MVSFSVMLLSDTVVLGVICKEGIFAKFCEISKDTFFTEHLWPTPSVPVQRQQRNTRKRCEICSNLTIKAPEPRH